jgi:ABC-2 type transport system ATP-binding protein
MDVIEVGGLGKRYGRTWALRDCTLSVPAGCVTGLVGPNGAGLDIPLRERVGTLSGGQRAQLAAAARSCCPARRTT